MKRNAILLFLWGMSFCSWGQWSGDLSQNDRVSGGGMNSFGFSAVTGEDGSVMVIWSEREGNAAIMYAKKYRADGTVSLAKKEIFRYTSSESCSRATFTGVSAQRASGSDDVFVLYTLGTQISILSSAETWYLQYQIISFNDASPKIPVIDGNESRGINLGYNYGSGADVFVFLEAMFIKGGGGRLAVAWQQKNNPSDTKRGGGGNLANGTDIRLAILDPSNRSAPTAYFHEEASGEQTLPKMYATGNRIFVSYVKDGNRLAVRRYNWNGTTITKDWGGSERLLGNVTDLYANVGMQASDSDTGDMYALASLSSADNTVKKIQAHRFDVATGTFREATDLVGAQQVGPPRMAGGNRFRPVFIYTSNGRQKIQRFEGQNRKSAETDITFRTHSGDPTFGGTLISESPDRYLLAGENRDNGEIYAQIIRFDSDTGEGVREWGNDGKIISNASGSRNGPQNYMLNSNAYLFLWRDLRNRTNDCTGDAYLQVVDKDGNPFKVSISKPTLNRTNLCTKDTLVVTFTTTGTFNSGNVFTAELIPEGSNTPYTSLSSRNTTIVGNTIRFRIDEYLSSTITDAQKRFKVRVRSSNPVGVSVEDSEVFTIVSNPSVVAQANSQKNLQLCEGRVLVLSGTSGFTSYIWTGPGNFRLTSTVANLTPFSAGPSSSGMYHVRAVGSCGESRDSVRVTVSTVAKPNAVSEKSTYYVGETIGLKVENDFSICPPACDYTIGWTGPGGFTGSGLSVSRANASVSMSGSYIVTVRSGVGCENKDTVLVTVSTKPVTGITNVSVNTNSVCLGSGISVSFGIEPSDGVGNFSVFLVDGSGQKVGGSLGSGTQSPLQAMLPASIGAGSNYQLLVESGTVRGTSRAIGILASATAQMLQPSRDTSIIYRKTGNNFQVRVRLTGSGPFTLTFSGGRTVRVQNAGDTTLSFRIETAGPFSIQSVSGACGGSLQGVQTVQLGLKQVVAIEDPIPTDWVEISPNPVSDKLTLKLKNSLIMPVPLQLRLIDMRGNLITTQQFLNQSYELDCKHLPIGSYVLEVSQGKHKESFKIIKY